MPVHEDNLDLPTHEDAVGASTIPGSIAHCTPMQTSTTLDNKLGVKAYIKCENLQRMGAFKFCGGYTTVSHCKDTASGILAYSSGNHAQAITLASKLHGIPSTVIMPKDAPPLKLKATQSYGGNVDFYDRYTEK